MKRYILIFLLAIFTTTNAKSITVARVGLSQPYFRDRDIEKSSKKTVSYGIGKRFYHFKPSHFYWGFDLIYSQGKMTTKKATFSSDWDPLMWNVYIGYLDVKLTNIQMPLLLGYSFRVSEKRFLNIESGILSSYAYKMSYNFILLDLVELSDAERPIYPFDYYQSYFPVPIRSSLNWLLGADFVYRFVGFELRYLRALRKIGAGDMLPHQYIDSFSFNLVFYF